LTLENFLLALAAESRRLPNNGLRLLIHVVAKVIETSSYTVSLSDREICEELGIGRGHFGLVKGSIAHLVKVHASAGVASTFTVPQSWFPIQPTLFSTDSGTLAGPPVAPNGGHLGESPMPSGTLAGPPVAPNGGHHWHPDGATLPPNEGKWHPGGATSGTLAGPPATENQQLTDAGTHRVLDDRDLSPFREYVFRVLDGRHLKPARRPEAAELATALQHYLATYGNVENAKTLPDDALLARCLHVAPLRDLLQVLTLVKPREGRPKGYGWFLTVFLENLKGIPREAQKRIREEYTRGRAKKPPQQADSAGFEIEDVRAEFRNVKGLR